MLLQGILNEARGKVFAQHKAAAIYTIHPTNKHINMSSTIKFFATLFLLVHSSVLLKAQTNRFSISINSLTTNFNYGKLNSDLHAFKKNYRGLQAGVSYQAGITKMFSIVPELYFAVKGGTLKENNPLTINKSTLRIYSIELPILARFHFNHFYLNAGTYTGYNTGGRLKIAGDDLVPETTKNISFGHAANAFKRWDAGWQAGAGYNFPLKKSVLTLDVRYGYGLVNISRDVQRYNRMPNISLQIAKLHNKH